MNDKSLYYKPSLEINIARLSMAILIGLITSLVLGYLYNLLSSFIPIIYFNVLITIGLGVVIGLSTRIISKLSHLNNKKSRLILLGVIIIATYLFQWIAYLSALENGFMLGIGDYLASIPEALFSGAYFGILPDLYTYGSWGIGDFVFNKFFLLIIWLLELGIIAYYPILSILGITEYPYSTNFSKWYPKFTLSDQFESIASKKYFLEDYKEDILSGVRSLQQGDGRRHGKIHIYFLEDENKQYLSFEKVFYEGNEGKKTSTFLLENLELSTSEAKSILKEFHNEKERFEVL